MITRDDCLARDAHDPLAPLRGLFALPAGLIYLDGNSLGALPAATPARVAQVVADEWGCGLIGSWNAAGWLDLAQRIGDRIAPLIGAGAGEVTVADSTSIDLFKAAWSALDLVQRDAPARNVIVTEPGNFPTDRYILHSLAAARGCVVREVAAEHVATAVDANTALLALTHVNYRTGAVHDMAALDRAAHAGGALAVWDLAHSAGALPVDVKGGGDAAAAADFAVGCGYKYLNGGPGAPAFLWAHPRHVARMDALGLRSPLAGWLGHATPFAFADAYAPARGIRRFQCGTPPILSLAALECGVDTLRAADAQGGIPALRTKSLALSELFVACVEQECAGFGLALLSPRDPSRRGSQASFMHAHGAYPIMQALIARGVVGDFRAPDVLRFGFAPLYTRFVDAFDAAAALRDVLASGEWRAPRFSVRAAVT
jgi:kynureninase